MDGSPLSPNDLATVESVTSLLELLQDKLGWELDVDDIDDLDDVTYDWGPEELALKPEHRAKLREIKQLRPFESDQDWAVFFVSFESEGRLPITVLRRVLRGLTLRGRTASAENAAWHREDILFISAFGKGAERELAFAHFHDETGGDLPRLSVLGWDEADTDRRKALTAERLGGLSYEPGENADARRERWSAVFRGTKRQAITDSRTLARELAVLAAAIRGRVNELIAAEDEAGHLRRMHAAFQRTLIEGLSADEFADTFAQTVAYGLLTAALDSRTSGALVMQDLVHMVPPTNPFLRGLFERFLHMGGRDHDQLLDYDELGLLAVIDLLQAADLEAVRADFDARRRGEDPVIFLYEDFLQHYDAALRMKRGVYYTPRSVVGFIVRGVDQILREEFGLPLGLADTSTWGEVAARIEAVKVPDGVDPSEPFVRILDPATGTGTFLVEAIDLIEKRMKAQWKGETEERRRALWQDYVELHLLPRLTGFELMMAPYAIAHMKVELKLSDTGFVPQEGMRLGVYLTNALEPPRDFDMELDFMFDTLAREARAANGAKRHPHTVIVGNPPYSEKSQNMQPFAVERVRKFRTFRGEMIRERGALQFEKNIQDDYVKFIGLVHDLIENVGSSAVGLITNHSFLSAPTLRGVREKIVIASDRVRIVDLHGDSKKKEADRIGIVDENVFEIQQGVAISFLSAGVPREPARIADVWGAQEEKYQRLRQDKIAYGDVDIDDEMCRFVPVSGTPRPEWRTWVELPRVFRHYSTGFETGANEYISGLTPAEVSGGIARLSTLALEDLSGHAAKLWTMKRTLAKRAETDIRPFAFTPYDTSYFLNVPEALKTNGNKVFSQVSRLCPALVTTRQTKGEFGAMVVDSPIGHKFLSSYDRSSCFPRSLVIPGRIGSPEGGSAFFAIVALLCSSEYQRRYKEQLLRDWPRIPPLGHAPGLCETLAAHGRRLTALHLLDVDAAPELRAPAIRLAGTGSMQLGNGGKNGTPCWEDGKVRINDTRWFETVPEAVWNFRIGGYQPAQKWLKDRAGKGGKNRREGRILTEEDVLHYRRFVTAMQLTIPEMTAVDSTIEAHGGWPAAFSIR